MNKLAFVIPSLGIGGAEKLCLELGEALAKDYLVYIVTFGDKVEFPINKSVRHVPLGIGGGTGSSFLNAFSLLRKLRRTLRAINPYGIISFMERANIFCRIALMGSGQVFVPTIHATVHSFSDRGNLARFFIAVFYRFCFPKGFKFITVSPHIRDELMRVYRFTNIAVVANGVSTNKYHILPKKNDNRFRLLVVSRLHPEKQTAIAILTTHILIKRNIPATLTIIGDGPERIALESLVRDLDLSGHVTFLGAITNPFQGNIIADCLLVTSKSESFGINIIEAILCGIPVLSLDCPTGPKDIFSLLNGQGIRIVPYHSQDHEALASTFAATIANDFYGSDRVSNETIAAIGAIRHEYSMDKVANGYLSVIDEIRAARLSG